MSSAKNIAEGVIEEVKRQQESTKPPKKLDLLRKIVQDLEKLTAEARAILEGEPSASEKEEPSVTEEKVWVVYFVVLFLSASTSCSHFFFFFLLIVIS